MSKNGFNFDYDPENDLLYIYKNEKAFGSVEFGEDIIIDFDKKMNVVGLEFLGASEILSKLSKNKAAASSLPNLHSAKFNTVNIGGLIVIIYTLKFANDCPAIENRLTIPDITRQSPVLAGA